MYVVCNTTIWKALILLTILVIVDYYVTVLVIDIHGYGAELNPLLYYLMIHTNSTNVILYAKVVLLTIAWTVTTTAVNQIQNKRLIVAIICIVCLFHIYAIGKGISIYTAN